MISGIIFDLDGVIIESEPYYFKAEIEIFRAYGIELTDEIIKDYLGYKLDDYIEELGERFNKELDVELIKKQFLTRVEEMFTSGEIPLAPYADEVLQKLREEYKLALATSREKYLAQIILKHHNIAHYFENGVYFEDVIKGKPDPEVFLKAADLIGISPENAVVVEDSKAGLKAAKSANMKTIVRKAGHNDVVNFSEADSIITDLRELPQAIKNL